MPCGPSRQPQTRAKGTGLDPVAQDNGLGQRGKPLGDAIKHALGRGDMPVSSQDALRYFQESGYRFAAVEELPAHHQDPFDRILVAQALVVPMRLMTHDATVVLYSDTIIEV